MAICLVFLHAANLKAANGSNQLFVYTCDQLIWLRQGATKNSTVILDIPSEIWRGETEGMNKKSRKTAARNGQLSGKKQRKQYKPHLPFVIMGKVSLLDNKRDQCTS